MPFTVSHGAAVLPFQKICPRFLILSGLLIGSFAPDLCYFINQLQWGAPGHTWKGTFTVCIPLGLSAWFLAFLLRKPFAAQLPSPHREYWLQQASEHPLYQDPVLFLGKLILSIWLGSLTHLIWDSFTHANGVFGRLSWVQPQLFQVKSYRFHVYNLLHHLSSLVGLACLAFAYRQWSIRTGLEPHLFRLLPRKTLFRGFIWSVLSLLLGLALCYPILKTGFKFFSFHLVVTSIQVFMIGLLVWACLNFWVFQDPLKINRGEP